jgi:hypothetical protein
MTDSPLSEAIMERDIIQTVLGDRHRLDAIARAVVTGARGLGAVEDAMADDLASIMSDRLRAAGVTGYHRVAEQTGDPAERWQQIKQRYGRELLDLLIRRTDKHLGSAALLAYTGVGS